MSWINVAQDRNHGLAIVNMVMDCKIPHDIGNFLSDCLTVGFPRRIDFCLGSTLNF
jgi:hypothetical protein